MVTFEFELTIDRPPKEVFDYLEDPVDRELELE